MDNTPRELQLFYEISTFLSGNIDLDIAMQTVLGQIANYHQILSGSITILNRTDGQIEIQSFYGMSIEEAKRGIYHKGEGITGKVYDTGNPVIVEKISQEPAFLDRTGMHKKLKAEQSFVCVPIKTDTEVIGALSITLKWESAFKLQTYTKLLMIAASIVSLTVHMRQENIEEVEALQKENFRLQAELHSGYRPQNIIGESKIMKNLYVQMQQVARTNTTVLLLGESGVGKEKFAQAIHYCSGRADKPFITINCAALPESIIESELFGHEKGAFTDAKTMQRGKFELASCGTIFLDEIGEMPLSLQGKFLRVLQEHEFERIGGTATIHADIRVIAATNRDLQELIKEGKFRVDLFYRLNVFPLVIPPLRERRTDIPLLINHFVEMYAKEQNKEIKAVAQPAMNLMMAYDWPGNIRELSNCIERAVILSTDEIIHSYHLPTVMQKPSEDGDEKNGTLYQILDSVEREVIQNELDKNNGNMAKTADALGITERIIGLRVSKYKLRH
ncbi:MAG: sigma 54-interacting transcriptional regulator [Treponema sp.]|nr:sigma 54-interacting transcriptional regulator [Treponema sp.]